MKTFREYLAESEAWADCPRAGDEFDIELAPDEIVESQVLESDGKNIVLEANEKIINLLSQRGMLSERIARYGPVGSNQAQGYTAEEANTTDPLADKAAALAPVGADGSQEPVDTVDEELDEAEYQGRNVPLNKPMRGDVKKFKVYVKDPKTGNVKKVNFGHGGTSARRAGQKTMKIKKSNPARRRSFRARHRCDNPGPKTKARYWSCRAW
jgi:hypothetical protein